LAGHTPDKNAYTAGTKTRTERVTKLNTFIATARPLSIITRTFISVDSDAKLTPLGTVFGNSKEEAPSKTLRIAGAI